MTGSRATYKRDWETKDYAKKKAARVGKPEPSPQPRATAPTAKVKA